MVDIQDILDGMEFFFGGQGFNEGIRFGCVEEGDEVYITMRVRGREQDMTLQFTLPFVQEVLKNAVADHRTACSNAMMKFELAVDKLKEYIDARDS